MRYKTRFSNSLLLTYTSHKNNYIQTTIKTGHFYIIIIGHFEQTKRICILGVNPISSRNHFSFILKSNHMLYNHDIEKPSFGTNCWKIWFCISYKTQSESNKHGFISFIIDNIHYVNFRI